MWVFYLTVSLINPGFNFLRINPTAYPSIPSEPSPFSIYLNPAGIISEKITLWASYNHLFLDIYQSCFTFNLENTSLSFNYWNFGKFEYQTDIPLDSPPNPFFNPYAFILKIGKSYEIDPEASLGVSLSLLRQKILDKHVNSWFISFGFLFRPKRYKNISFGTYIDKLSFKSSLNREDFQFPIEVKGGTSIKISRSTLSFSLGRILGFQKPTYETDFNFRVFISENMNFWLGYNSFNKIYPYDFGLQIQKDSKGVIFSFSPSKETLDESYRVTLFYTP